MLTYKDRDEGKCGVLSKCFTDAKKYPKNNVSLSLDNLGE